MNRKRICQRRICRKRILGTILLFMLASLDLCMVRNLEQNHGLFTEKAELADEEGAFEVLRAFELPADAYAQSAKMDADMTEALLACLFCQTSDRAVLTHWCRREKAAMPKLYASFSETVGRLLADAAYFPVPEALDNGKAAVSYENSWQYERTYGGTRGHEGCDIMAGIQKRGYYPVVSVSDGVVEKIGWLPLGGYRVGIRSRHGVYYYYAHLAEYEEGISQGSKVTAGQLLGYMGDTGYSEVEGTTGQFPVHLHFGMYLDDGEGNEVSYNPYSLLKLLESQKLRYIYET